MKKAIYRNDDGREVELNVAKEHESGAVDLANDDGTVVVEKCPIATKPGQAGHCTGEGLKAKTDKEIKAAAAAKVEPPKPPHK